jgi:two-component system chemotaxis sensor kinase CheA
MGEVTNPGLQQDFDLSQFYAVFFEEAGENLASYESMLLAIDVDTATDDELNAIFRVAHSIKGGAATFGFSEVTELTHELETLLDRVRRHELALKREMVDVLIESGDVLKTQLALRQANSQGSSDGPDTSDLVARIKTLAAGKSLAPVPTAPVASVPEATSAPTEDLNDGKRRLRARIGPLKDASIAGNICDLFRDIPALGNIEAADDGALSADGFREFKIVTASADSELLELFSFHVSREQVSLTPWAAVPAAAPAVTPSAPTVPVAAKVEASKDPGYGFFVDPQTLPAAQGSTVAEAPKTAARETKPKADAKTAGGAGASLESTTLRVSVEKVDQLINLVGELVITQAMLAQQAKQFDPVQYQALTASVSDLERYTRHLQEAVMSIRMIPMSFVFNRFPRVLRDLAGKLGKDIELKMVGEATELDKGLIEKITDPLTHLVRNSADHGIEVPAKRIAAGKSATGTITLSAAHQGGSILIEVRDDGAGLNRQKIFNKAKERGLPVRDDMSDHEVWQLIWEPGFSTADQITDVSGRGVGMDVVRKNIASLGGTVELDSAEGFGTRVSVRLPLTLAIMDGMSIGVGDEVYILPLASVVESFQVDAGSIKTVTGSEKIVKVRDEYMPVLALDQLFSVPRFDFERVSEIMVIIEAEGQRIALLVDQLLGQQQVVVKNLETNYRKVPGVSGATILGDGKVALIVDVAAMVKRTRH